MNKSSAVTALQIKNLRDRLNNAGFHSSPALPETPEVKAARKVIAAFESKRRKAKSAAYNKRQKRIREITDLILFGDIDKARLAVEKFEKESRK